MGNDQSSQNKKNNSCCGIMDNDICCKEICKYVDEKEVDKKTLKKMPKNSPTFLAAVNGMPSGEIPSLVKDMEIKDVRIVVEQQVKAGNIEDMILSPVTRPGVTKEQKNRPENIERLKGVTVPSAAEDAAKEMSEAAKEMSKAAKEIGKTSKGGGEKKKTNKI